MFYFKSSEISMFTDFCLKTSENIKTNIKYFSNIFINMLSLQPFLEK